MRVRRRKRFRWRWLWWSLLLIPGLPLIAVHVMSWMFTPPPLKQVFAGRPLPVQRAIEGPDGRRISSMETGKADGPLVMFIHGTPGSWNAFMGFMADPALADRALIVSIDRPGWGASAAGGLETSLAGQARACAAVIQAHPQNRPVVLVGHSLGGAVAPRVAIDFPEIVDTVIIVAGSIDPALEETTWYQAFARWRIVQWMLPEELVRSDRELAPFKAELEAMMPLWDKLRASVIVIQGIDDGLVPAANADFAERVITHAPLQIERIPHQGHMIPWEQPQLITNAILRALDPAAAAR